MSSAWVYVRRHHVGLIALMLVVVGGSAYAAGLAKNSVKSKQIKNGQVKSVDVADEGLTSADVKGESLSGAEIADGSIAGADVADGAIAGADVADGAISQAKLDPGLGRIASASGTFPTDNFFRAVLSDLGGLGQLEAKCNVTGDNLAIRYRNTSSATSAADIVIRDPVDASPGAVAAATVTPAGILPVGPTTFTGGVAEGNLWVSGAAGVTNVEVALLHLGADCQYWAQATIDSE